MSDETVSEPTGLPLDILDQLDRICDRFEAALGRGEEPRPEDYLGEVAAPYRPALLDDLRAAASDPRRRGRPARRTGSHGRPSDDPSIVDRNVGGEDALTGGTTAPAGSDETTIREASNPRRSPAPDLTCEAGAKGAAPARTTGPGDCVGPASDREPLPAQIRDFGDYELTRILGRGGMGVVYEGRQIRLGRPVAVKMLRAGSLAGDEELRRFQNESEAVARLDHPSIVPIYEVGEHDSRHYFSMKLVPGGSLADRLDAFQADPRAAATLLAEVAEAVHHAHMRGVLHRDLKPANILIDEQGRPHITDFGLACNVQGDGSLTASGVIVGTPSYMAPEQAVGRRSAITTATDVYGLGAVLYALLTGRAPFTGDSVMDTLNRVKDQDPEPPHRLNKKVSRDLEIICLRCLEKDARRRYSSARALAEDLRAWLGSRPIAARPVGLPSRVALWCRRRPAIAALTAAVALALVGGTAAVLIVQAGANAVLEKKNLDLSDGLIREAKANADLKAASERERQQFDLALEAIRRNHTGVSEDFLLKQEQFKDLRNRLLRDAVEFYRKLEGLLTAQTDAQSRRALARAYEEVGDLSGRLGLVREALESHRKALEVRRTLALPTPSDPTTGGDVGRSLIAIGMLLSESGRRDEALETLSEARSVLGRLGGSAPVRDVISADIARSWYYTGNLHYHAGQMRQAMAANQAGLAIASAVAEADPNLLDNQRLLAWLHNNIGIIRLQGGEADAALRAFEASRRIKQKIADENPRVAEYRRDLAVTYYNIGFLVRESGRLSEALAAHEATLAIRRSLADAYPGVTGIRRDQANSLIEIGDLLRAMGTPAKAQKSYEQAIAILEAQVEADRTVAENYTWLIQGLKGLGATQFAAGQVADAVATWRRAIVIGASLRSPYDESFYYLAGCHALLGRAAGVPGSGLSPGGGPVELGKGMESLGRAVAAGYRDVAWMRRDPDLDPLRTRRDFQDLMLDLAFPADPFAYRVDEEYRPVPAPLMTTAPVRK